VDPAACDRPSRAKAWRRRLLSMISADSRLGRAPGAGVRHPTLARSTTASSRTPDVRALSVPGARRNGGYSLRCVRTGSRIRRRVPRAPVLGAVEPRPLIAEADTAGRFQAGSRGWRSASRGDESRAGTGRGGMGWAGPCVRAGGRNALVCVLQIGESVVSWAGPVLVGVVVQWLEVQPPRAESMLVVTARNWLAGSGRRRRGLIAGDE
jgi:hypothetical protein